MPHPIVLESVKKHYGRVCALDGIDLSVAEGGVFALLGRNGAGKTTTIQCALGLVSPDDGLATIFGHRAGSVAARRVIGAMLQEAHLPDNLSAREHLSLFANYYPEPASVETVIHSSGVQAFADKRYKHLSGGQKRRVQFALAMIGQPKILFLDEPTTGLDPDAREAVWRNIRALTESGCTIVLTTHYLEEADALADRICILDCGRIIADDTASAIRQQVSGALIQCQSAVTESQAQTLPAVREVGRSGARLTLLSDDAQQTLTGLFEIDRAVTDLTVRKPSLEEAFTRLVTSESGETS